MTKKNWNRRKFLKWTTLGALAAALPVPLIRLLDSNSRGPSGLPSDALNVLFMTVDDVGWRDLSCYGNGNIKTPHLDSLAKQGIRFDRAFGVSSSCSPSRASFITGQYISTHGVDGLVHRYLGKQLSPFHPTMARYFKEAGYHTAIQGKWHVSLLPARFYGYKDFLGAPVPWNHIEDTTKIERYFKKRSKDGKPFYLELNFADTHRTSGGKFEKGPDFVVDPETISVPDWMGLPDWPEIRADLALYYGKLLRTDHLIGETLEALRKTGLEENTMVVFVSDNGSPFPGNKMTLLDRGIGTPLLIRLPGKIEENRVSNALISTVDLMPTILNLCNIKFHDKVEGKSFHALLMDSGLDNHREQLFSEMNCHVKSIPMRSIRTEKWKAILNLSDAPIGLDDLEGVDWAMRLCKQKDQPWLQPRVPFELYDLEKDPFESNNLAGRAEVASVEAGFRRRLSEDWNKVK